MYLSFKFLLLNFFIFLRCFSIILLQAQSRMSRIPLSQYTDICFQVSGLHGSWYMTYDMDGITTVILK